MNILAKIVENPHEVSLEELSSADLKGMAVQHHNNLATVIIVIDSLQDKSIDNICLEALSVVKTSSIDVEVPKIIVEEINQLSL